MGHLPDLQDIDKVEDPSVRFYAIIGACISLVANVEHALFGLYVDASGLSEADAASVYYRHVRFSHKRNTVDAAVRAVLAKHSLGAKWDELLRSTQDLCGDGAARNLLGHNAVSDVLSVVPTKSG